jgi:hypothetical protein
MTLLFALFAMIQAVGAVVGAGGSVFAEVFYFEAIRDGKIDESERAHLRTIAEALRWGMILLLVGSIGLVILSFAYLTPTQPAETSAYWLQMFLAFTVLVSSFLLSRTYISFTLGSAAVFTAWWLIAFLAFGQLTSLSFGEGVAFFVVALAVIAAVLTYIRSLVPKSLSTRVP